MDNVPVYHNFDPNRPLTPEQAAFAEALFRKLEQLRCSGVKHAIVTLTNPAEPWRVASVGRRVEIR